MVLKIEPKAHRIICDKFKNGLIVDKNVSFTNLRDYHFAFLWVFEYGTLNLMGYKGIIIMYIRPGFSNLFLGEIILNYLHIMANHPGRVCSTLM